MKKVKKKTAKLAAKKGYNIIASHILYKVVTTGREVILDARSMINVNEKVVYIKLAYIPSQTALQKWLREKHNLHVNVIMTMGAWGFEIQETNEPLSFILQGCKVTHSVFDSYEKALEKGMRYALSSIKN